MQQGITVNVGDYQSIRLDSSEYNDLVDIYKDLLSQLRDWKPYFGAMKHWEAKLLKLIEKHSD